MKYIYWGLIIERHLRIRFLNERILCLVSETYAIEHRNGRSIF